MKKTMLFLAICIALLFPFTFTVSADDISADVPLLIDDMHDLNGKTSPDAAISKAVYTADTFPNASSDSDMGYLFLKKSNYRSGQALTTSVKLSSPVNLYRYSNVCFYYKIPEPVFYENGTAGAENEHIVRYYLTVTLISDGTEFTTRLFALSEDDPESGESGWNKVVIPVHTWNRRVEMTEVTISLTAVYSGADAVEISFMIDSLSAETPADTSMEDTFMSSSFSASGGSYNYLTSENTVEWRTSSQTSALTGNAIYESRQDASGHNTLRLALETNRDIEVKLLVSYLDGTGHIGEAVAVPASDSLSAVYIDLPNAENIKTFTLSAEGAVGAVIKLYNIDTLYLPESGEISDSQTGTLNSCTLDSSGAINLRGSIPADIVADHLKGTLAVYAIPIYADINEYLTDASPSAEAVMSTRYNITIPQNKLPHGAAAMLYTVFIKSGDELIMIGTPTLPDTAEAGVSQGELNKSIKGLASDSLTAADNAAVTEVTVDLSLLFGDTSSGRIYSSFGRLYYFNTEYLKELDSKIKPLSLSGTDIYIRLVSTASIRTKGSETVYDAITADTEEDFSSLYSAVDFISDRYSSAEYGYIRGIIIGNSVNDLHPNASSPTEYAISAIKAAAAVYGAAGANIKDLRVLFPFGDTYTSHIMPQIGDTELILELLAYYAEIYGLPSYGILWQTDSIPEKNSVGIKDIASLRAVLDLQDGAPPSYIFVEYTVLSNYFNAVEAVYDYMNAYYTVCETASVSAFVFKFGNSPSETVWNEFISYYSILDTDRKTEVETYLSASLGEYPVISDSAASRAHPYSFLSEEPLAALPITVKGAYKLFDYINSFDTGGWFTVSESGECSTVKSNEGRAMRALGGGIMYSSAVPMDLSASPVISIDSYSNSASVYELVFYSKNGVFRTEFTSTEKSSAVYFDLSDFNGIGSVYGILILPEDDSSTLYVSSIGCHSISMTDTELAELYSSADTDSEAVREPETKLLEILAFVFAVVVLSAAAFAAMRRKENQ